jgi:small-conductance mechanosensitive channel
MTMDSPFVQLETYAWPLFAAGLGLAVGIAVRRIGLPLIARAASRSAWKYDDALVEAARNPVLLWGALGGLYAGTILLPFPADIDSIIARAFQVAGILSVTWFSARFAGLALRARSSAGALAGVSLISNVARIVVFAIGVLFLLQALGISITPLITALGVGGLAVALALQDTLANLFSGIRILTAGKIRVGDVVRLENGLEGVVEDITLNQTTIRQLSNNLVLVPNFKLVQAITTNYSLPQTELAVPVQIGVAYGSDLARVEAVTLEVARSVQAEADGAVRGYEPLVRWHTFGDSAIQAVVVLRAHSFEQQRQVTSEFIKRLTARYAAEAIEIPFPQRVVHTPRQP